MWIVEARHALRAERDHIVRLRALRDLHLNGLETIKVKVPQGTQPDDVITLRSKGMPRLNYPQDRGNLYVQVTVEVPKRLSKAQVAHLNAFRELS